MMTKNRTNRFLFLICLLGFVIRIGYIFAFATYLDPPDWEYGDIARNLVQGKGFARIAYPSETLELTSSHAPFYPHVLSIAYSLFPPPWSFLCVQLIQSILSIFIIIIAFKTTELLFDKAAAFATALGVAIYPPIVYYSASITPTLFFLFFLSLTVVLLLNVRPCTFTKSILIGVAYGCALLCDPIAFALIPAVLFWFIVTRRKTTKYLLIALFVAFMVILPWSIRNLRVHKSCVPITTQFGHNFWIGNNPRATGTDYYRVVTDNNKHSILMTSTLPRSEKHKLQRMTEHQRSHYFISKAFNFIYKNPFQCIRLLVKKTLYYWWFSPSSINGSPTALQYRTIYALFYVPLLVFALFGFAIYALEHQPTDLILLLALIIMISAVYIVTHVGLARYRIPIEFFLLMMAGSTKSRLIKTLKS